MVDAPAPINPYQSPTRAGDDESRTPPRRGTLALVATLVVVLACALGAAGLSVPHAAGPYATSVARTIVFALDAIFGALLGIGLAAIVTVILHRNWSLLMPGHWRALETIAVLIGILASLPWQGQPGFTVGISSFFMWQLVMETVRNITAIALYVGFACFTRERIWWRTYAFVWLLAYLASLLQIPIALFNARADIVFLYLVLGALPWISALCALLGTSIVIIGAAFDIRAGVPRNMGHYGGLVLPVLSYVIILLANLVR